MQNTKKLRSGFTTGACAAAAAKAAVRILLTGEMTEDAELFLPGIGETHFSVLVAEYSRHRVCCAVKKDAGDDPDVTNGVMVYATVSRRTKTDKPCYHSEEYPLILLTGGEGIGIVTKEGLSCPPGLYAINPTPRAMIFKAVGKELTAYKEGRNESFLIEITIPEGINLASKTFNPKLGIKGGISVLGTTGVVNPMSEQALLETIRLEIRVRAGEGKRILAVAPGNYGEAFLKKSLGISMDYFVKCSNFVGDTFSMLWEEGIEEVLFAGHAGKLIKIAGGVLNTHSRYGDRRMEIFADCARAAGASKADQERLLGMNTTEQAVEYLHKAGCLDNVMEVVVKRIGLTIEEHCGIFPEIVVFSSVYDILGMTDGARKLALRLT